MTCRLKEESPQRQGQVKKSVDCDYRFENDFKPTQLTLTVGETQVNLERNDIRKYPADGQITAILAMFDVSDARRAATTTTFYPKILGSLTNRRPAHVVLGVATFAQSLNVVLPFQRPGVNVDFDLARFAATGAATELNRSALEAIRTLSRQPADRRILLLVSDGKAEDTVYKLADVVSEAQKFHIAIVTIGVAERPSETPSLQSLRVLAEQSRGMFFDFSGKVVPEDFQSRLLTVVDVGGRVSFNGGMFYGKRTVTVTLIDTEKRSISVKTDIEFPDSRGRIERLRGVVAAYWWALVIGALVIVLLLWASLYYRRIRRERQATNRVIAEFRGLDDRESCYEIRKYAVTAGRNAQNDIVIANSSVSGRHAELHRTREGGFRLSDLGSTNGTMVNGSRITAIDLNDGDIVEFAEVRFQFKITE